MLAYKFLAPGGIAPFTGRSWPVPGPHGPGTWVVAPPGDLARYGVHACRIDELAHWPDEELWLVELGGTILKEPLQLVAARGRLVERVPSWDVETAREYATACAWRARDLAAEALAGRGLEGLAGALLACADLASLQASATAVAADGDDAAALAAYVAGAALRARQARYPEASLQGAHLRAVLLGDEAGAAQERAWQSRWLAHRLELRELAA